MREKLRIAQVAPLAESVPPKLYGGTERVVSFLTEELVAMGHEVTLFASADSRTSAELVACCPQALRLKGQGVDELACTLVMLERVLERAQEFDVIHSHIDYLPFGLYRRAGVATLTTLHGRLDHPDLAKLYAEFCEMPVVAISEAQRQALPGAHWVGTVYHGLPPDCGRLNLRPEGYLAFLGRLSPEKRVESAIAVAQKTGIPLKIAAKVNDHECDYFDQQIRPLLDNPLIEFIGEIDDAQKNDFLGNARALLFMVDWPEPFGLAMIEAMACGTPVIARRCGSVPEVVDEGITGFVCDNDDEAVDAVARLATLSRRICREVFEERFTVSRMAQDYVRIYRHLLDASRGPEAHFSLDAAH
ncbi:MAG: glycosyltransferase family 4 protein [Bradymonadaceae bacterium]|nr:glycosyltransferase family 4 protein [Lujinxingiaceae bacterium]